ncbi:hypothetical protein TNCV_4723511 [Trichonephila clavipes]|uniref:Uncharacterized protein n=1 Tax=Trichonephila clavipes TaxID=2585209 RepID=A0A8X7BFE9_TRICX|nr:hypothetical protein TNCV_4723511 [Trichonephila clavipes]
MQEIWEYGLGWDEQLPTVDKKSRFCCKSGAESSCFIPFTELSCFSPVELSCSVRAAESSCFSSCNGFGFRVELFSPTAKLSCF